MANISNFEVNGVSYSYDMESRNPLSDKVKSKAVSGELVYDTNTKAPTEVVGVPANNLKVAEEADGSIVEPSEPSEPSVPSEPEIRTAIVYGSHSCGALGITIKYKGSISKANLDNFYGIIRYGYEGCGGYSTETEMNGFYFDEHGQTYEDNFFEFVNYEDPGSFTMYGDEAYLSDFGYRA